MAAHVAHGRPPVDEGRAAVPADALDDRPRDETDAERLASHLVESWVESSRRGGDRNGDGRGGRDAPGAPGDGAEPLEGGAAGLHAPGPGRDGALDTSDRRYVRWFLEQRRRILERLRFPRERALALDQGVSVWLVHVRRDGSFAGNPRLRRSSGFTDFDMAARDAIVAASPFHPLPPDLAPQRDVLAIVIPVQFSNPMVR
ncbi:MAG: TonB C-terminal domain-containing protein [Myxococcota bacterium]|nr:TonB C-terminal domain-containing protein [Myxococcota bacterium]MDW8360762.1 TonB C-terminal domain-containing protein [Myxococcales bacterium]